MRDRSKDRTEKASMIDLQGKTVAFCALSNPLNEETSGKQVEALKEYFTQCKIKVLESRFLFLEESVLEKPEREKAEEVNRFFKDPSVAAIFDLSGGDLANGVLPYLDYEVIRGSDAFFWGYSDLTTVINAIYTRSGRSSVLFQIRKLFGRDGEVLRREFETALAEKEWYPEEIPVRFLGKDTDMEGIVVGGNVRCFLKLAGTAYWPDLTGKILLLESMGGNAPQMYTFFSQLKQLGVFDKVKGILLGTFTKMEREKELPTAEEILLRVTEGAVPIAKTTWIGHGDDAKGIVIGGYYRFADVKGK